MLLRERARGRALAAWADSCSSPAADLRGGRGQSGAAPSPAPWSADPRGAAAEPWASPPPAAAATGAWCSPAAERGGPGAASASTPWSAEPRAALWASPPAGTADGPWGSPAAGPLGSCSQRAAARSPAPWPAGSRGAAAAPPWASPPAAAAPWSPPAASGPAPWAAGASLLGLAAPASAEALPRELQLQPAHHRLVHEALARAGARLAGAVGRLKRSSALNVLRDWRDAAAAAGICERIGRAEEVLWRELADERRRGKNLSSQWARSGAPRAPRRSSWGAAGSSGQRDCAARTLQLFCRTRSCRLATRECRRRRADLERRLGALASARRVGHGAKRLAQGLRQPLRRRLGGAVAAWRDALAPWDVRLATAAMSMCRSPAWAVALLGEDEEGTLLLLEEGARQRQSEALARQERQDALRAGAALLRAALLGQRGRTCAHVLAALRRAAAASPAPPRARAGRGGRAAEEEPAGPRARPRARAGAAPAAPGQDAGTSRALRPQATWELEASDSDGAPLPGGGAGRSSQGGAVPVPHRDGGHQGDSESGHESWATSEPDDLGEGAPPARHGGPAARVALPLASGWVAPLAVPPLGGPCASGGGRGRASRQQQGRGAPRPDQAARGDLPAVTAARSADRPGGAAPALARAPLAVSHEAPVLPWRRGPPSHSPSSSPEAGAEALYRL